MANDAIATNDFSVSAAVYTKNSAFSEAAEALIVLGYDKATVQSALKGIDTSVSDAGEVIRLALKKLAR